MYKSELRVRGLVEIKAMLSKLYKHKKGIFTKLFLLEEEVMAAGENIEFCTDQYLLDSDKSIVEDAKELGSEIVEDAKELIGTFTK